jgi:hypothetical protein
MKSSLWESAGLRVKEHAHVFNEPEARRWILIHAAGPLKVAYRDLSSTTGSVTWQPPRLTSLVGAQVAVAATCTMVSALALPQMSTRYPFGSG